jgi:uncharacterized protein with FMN-binding domain
MNRYILSSTVVASYIVFALIQQANATNQPANFSPQTSISPHQFSPSPTMAPNVGIKQYKDGSYTGPVTDAYYGNMQVQTSIKQGLITDVQVLQYPNDRHNSIMINNQALPLLKSEAIQAQSTNVDIISGATATSEAFIQSLQAALDQAKTL